jgi:hypothetical protein
MTTTKMILSGAAIAALLSIVGCGSSKWADGAKAMADEVCKCPDQACGNAAFKKFVADMTAHKDDVGTGDLDAIGDAEHRAEACIAKAKP